MKLMAGLLGLLGLELAASFNLFFIKPERTASQNNDEHTSVIFVPLGNVSPALSPVMTLSITTPTNTSMFTATQKPTTAKVNNADNKNTPVSSSLRPPARKPISAKGEKSGKRSSPSSSPTTRPHPTLSPTLNPTLSPTLNPNPSPNLNPPTTSPHPTLSPTLNPTLSPTLNPTLSPTLNPTHYPTIIPSFSNAPYILTNHESIIFSIREPLPLPNQELLNFPAYKSSIFYSYSEANQRKIKQDREEIPQSLCK
ncbi:hypothetical protein ACHAWX_002085 [Stephanocyclus meneghinianus]